ncbi:MAG: signal peptidase II [Candidatus Gastranaerophilales bacterium]
MQKLSKLSYLAVCTLFFVITNLFLSNDLVEKLQNGYQYTNSLLTLNYVENTGAAFSILQDARLLLISLSIIAIILVVLYVIKFVENIKMKSIFFVSLMLAGIFGNLYERIIYGAVRDYFQLNSINFPIFNISDIFINIAVIALIILILIKKT